MRVRESRRARVVYLFAGALVVLAAAGLAALFLMLRTGGLLTAPG
jgi:hypothetical protein